MRPEGLGIWRANFAVLILLQTIGESPPIPETGRFIPKSETASENSEGMLAEFRSKVTSMKPVFCGNRKREKERPTMSCLPFSLSTFLGEVLWAPKLNVCNGLILSINRIRRVTNLVANFDCAIKSGNLVCLYSFYH